MMSLASNQDYLPNSTLNQPESVPQPEGLALLPNLRRDEGWPVFAEPWQAQAFALAVRLCAQEHFTWSEWAAAIADELKVAANRGEPDDGSRYYPISSPSQPEREPRGDGNHECKSGGRLAASIEASMSTCTILRRPRAAIAAATSSMAMPRVHNPQRSFIVPYSPFFRLFPRPS
jgi:nitrile hydratase accessory protein